MIWAFHLAFWLTPTRIARPVSRAGLLGEPHTNSQRGLSADVDPAIAVGGRPHRLMSPQGLHLALSSLWSRCTRLLVCILGYVRCCTYHPAWTTRRW
jgi:hypothetical protein